MTDVMDHALGRNTHESHCNMDEQQTHTKCLHALCCCVCLCAYRRVPFVVGVPLCVCAFVCVHVCVCLCDDRCARVGGDGGACVHCIYICGFACAGNGRVWWASVDTWIGIGRFVG